MTQQPSFGLFGMLERAGDTYDFEFVRELTQVELERLRYCGQLLNKFSAYSPFEMALAKV